VRDDFTVAGRKLHGSMKIATFNINNVNKRLANLLGWLHSARPDVVCLQELKAADADFPRIEIERAGYGAVWRGERSWNGVAILARDREPVMTHEALPGDSSDRQSRYIAAAVNGVLIASIYAPNGNPQPGPKFTYKLAWMERLAAHAAELNAADLPVVLAGDYNVVPTDKDIYPTKSYADNALVRPESRAVFQRILDIGWSDAIRTLHPHKPMYTFWDYKRNRWQRDAGLRLDHFLLSPKAAKRLVDAGVDRQIRGEPNASDHAPAWIMLKDKSAKSRTAATRKSQSKAKARRVKSASSPAERRPLLVIDGDSFAHRSYHALPKTIRMEAGKPAGGILGFANVLIRFYNSEKPRAVLVAWDTLEAPTYRHEAFPAYQSGRVFDEALLEQLRLLPSLVKTFGFANAQAPGYEADDFLAAAAAAERKRGGNTLVASGDRDTFQLASDTTTILFPVRAGEMARIGPAEVVKRYGVEASQVPDFIALRGDPSDKLPGAPGVGPAGAASLLKRHGSLEAALRAGRFAEQAERLRLFRSIATMNPDAPLPSLRSQKPRWRDAAALAKEWGLSDLATRLSRLIDA
jgi:exodeoxyribonuclease III